MTPVAASNRASSYVLITGGAGFVGSHLAEHLVALGRDVVVLDDLSSGSEENLEGVLASGRCRLQIGDAGDRRLLADWIEGASEVFHLAGAVGVAELARDPVGVMERNLEPTRIVLEVASAAGVPTLITSSSEVYGNGPVPFREDAPVSFGRPTDSRGGYACAKAMGEWLALARHRAADWPLVVARLFNTVGPRQSRRQGMVLPRFAAQATAGGPITVYGSGDQTRCFAHVGDVVAMLVRLLGNQRAHGRIVNVGCDREVAVHELARLVRERSRCVDAEIQHVPFEDVYPAGFYDPPRRVPCLDVLRELLVDLPERPLLDVVDDVVRDQALRLTPASAPPAGDDSAPANRPDSRSGSAATG